MGTVTAAARGAGRLEAEVVAGGGTFTLGGETSVDGTVTLDAATGGDGTLTLGEETGADGVPSSGAETGGDATFAFRDDMGGDGTLTLGVGAAGDAAGALGVCVAGAATATRGADVELEAVTPGADGAGARTVTEAEVVPAAARVVGGLDTADGELDGGPVTDAGIDTGDDACDRDTLPGDVTEAADEDACGALSLETDAVPTDAPTDPPTDPDNPAARAADEKRRREARPRRRAQTTGRSGAPFLQAPVSSLERADGDDCGSSGCACIVAQY